MPWSRPLGPLPFATLLLAAFCVPRTSAEQPPERARKHITTPFKPVGDQAWAADGSCYLWEIEDKVLGRLTLTVCIARVADTTYTVAADGTDWEATYPLPPEASASLILPVKKKALGEPLDARRHAELIRFCIGARYFRYAEAELAQATELSNAVRTELTAELVEARARVGLETARELSLTGQFEDAGRVLADALALVAASPPSATAAKRLQEIERDGRELVVKLSGEAQARGAWQDFIQQMRAALHGAQGPEAKLIEQLLPDLDGPLPAARRAIILKELRAGDVRPHVNYSQALEALKELCFAVRYGELLTREDTPGLDAFFAAEALVNAYLDAPDKEAPAALDRIVALRGLSDKALKALIRRGRRVPAPPAATGDQSPQGPFARRATTGELEVALDYLLMLPVDYHPSRPRPLLTALHGTYAEARTALQTWAPEALKRGWIVAAPECVIGRGKGYLSVPEERAMIRRLLTDCARNFAIDPNRLYLAGHSMGAYMGWDVALTDPDRYAALAAIGGCVNGLSASYLTNLGRLPVYCVGGARDATVTRVNRLVREELNKYKMPWTYVEYPDRGHELFLEELPKIFAWLDKQVRPQAPAPIDFVSSDLETNRAWWLQMRASEAKKDETALGADKLPLAIRTGGLARLSGTASAGNHVTINARNLRTIRIWVTDELFDLSRPLLVIINNRPEHPLTFQPSRKRLLEIVRQTGDRERLYWATIDLTVPK